MYQGSEPPDISQSPVPDAFIAGRTFQPVRTAKPVINAVPTNIPYECCFHHLRNSECSLLGEISPNIPRPAIIIAPTFNQNTSKNQVNILTLSSPFNVESGKSFPIS